MGTRTINEEERTEPAATPSRKRKQPSDSVPSPARSPSPENIYTDPSPPRDQPMPSPPRSSSQNFHSEATGTPTLWPRFNANFPFRLFDAFVQETDNHRFDDHTNGDFLDEGMSYLVKANAVFGRLRPRHLNAESDEETLRRENNLLKSTLTRERGEHEATLHVNEGLQRELAQTKGDLRDTDDVLSSIREELKTSKASEQKLANMNVKFVAETEALKNTNEELVVANQNLSIQLGEVQTKARADRKTHRAKRRKLRSKIKVLEERDPPLIEELRKQIQADYHASNELGAEILKVYYEGYEDCRERGKEKLAAAQLDPALIDSDGEGGV